MVDSVACIAERSVCALRVTRLGADCVPLTGPTDGAIALAIATITATAEVQEGTKFEPVDGCGRTVYSAADPDVVKRKNLTMELVTQDFAFIELATDATVILGGAGTPAEGKIIGINEPGVNTAAKPGIALEIWTKTATGTGECGETEDGDALPGWVYHILPHVKLRLGDRTFENAHANVSFAGTATANPLWGEGPWGDWEAAGDLDANTPHARMLNYAGPPEGECGYVTPSQGS